MADANRDKVVSFVRHGQSEDNVAPVFQAPHSPLSAVGRHQAARLAARVSHLAFDALLASPYQRAKATAAAIGNITGKAPECVERFTERVQPTSINGTPSTDAPAQRTWQAWEHRLYTPGRRVEDGENSDDLLTRAEQALALLTDRAEPSIVVVTHGYFLRTMVARVMLGAALSGDTCTHFHTVAAMANTGLTVLRYHVGVDAGPGGRLWIYNAHAHLAA